MPDITPRLGLRKPLSNEAVTRAAYNENMDIIDQNTAKTSDLAAHLAETMPHRFVDGATTYRYGLKVVGGVLIMQYEEVV
jgi:hypothetical protein